MAACRVTVRVKVAWWLRWYLGGVAAAAQMVGAEPDMQKVERVVRRALRVEAR